MSKICFETKIMEINNRRIILFPKEASLSLPTRGMTMVQGTLNEVPFESDLEPDGNGSHWFNVSDVLAEMAGVDVGDIVSVCSQPLQEWYEPDLPSDLMDALKSNALWDVWQSLTVKARWEWVRWIRFTNNPDTRQKRIFVTCSKLNAGSRRPCCFDLSRCTDMEVGKSGVLDLTHDETAL